MTQFPPLRLGIFGSGTAASLTLSQLAGSDLVDVAAIAARTLASAQAAATRFGIGRAVAGFEAVLEDPSIEAVYIALPISAHAQWACAALAAGKHVLVEKPATASVAELKRIEAAQLASGKLFMEGMMVHHHPQWEAVSDLIRDGAIGDVRAVQGTLTRVPPDADNPDAAINRTDLGWSVLLDNGCYMVSLARLAFGSEPERVSALGERDPRFGTLASASALMHFPTGVASFTVSTKMRRMQRINILGSDGRIEVMWPVMQVGGQHAVVSVDSKDVIPPAPPRELVFENVAQFRLQMESFARAVRGLEPVRVPLSNALGNMRALDALALSADAAGAWMDVEQDHAPIAEWEHREPA